MSIDAVTDVGKGEIKKTDLPEIRLLRPKPVRYAYASPRNSAAQYFSSSSRSSSISLPVSFT